MGRGCRPGYVVGFVETSLPGRREGPGRDRILMEEPGPYPCAASAADMLEALLVWRRDVRHFLARPIPENEMERLFALAQLAPSVGNALPWRYSRVRSAFVDRMSTRLNCSP